MATSSSSLVGGVAVPQIRSSLSHRDNSYWIVRPRSHLSLSSRFSAKRLSLLSPARYEKGSVSLNFKTSNILKFEFE